MSLSGRPNQGNAPQRQQARAIELLLPQFLLRYSNVGDIRVKLLHLKETGRPNRPGRE
jgi:hypothetical protein